MLKHFFMYKFLLTSILVCITVIGVSQTTKKPRPRLYTRSYAGCNTYIDSIIRKAAWITLDSLRVRNFIK